MGQYYSTMLKDRHGILAVDPSDFDCGLKLMEHSYISKNNKGICSNEFLDEVANYLYEKHYNVAWIGDYAEQDDESEVAFQRTKNFDKYKITVWNMSTERIKKYFTEFDWTGKVLANITKEQEISFDKYVENVISYRGNQEDSGSYIVCPLPLLTACGNGLGGGDYQGLNMELVGSWAGDELTIFDGSVGLTDISDKIFEED